jgi:extracellular elastinolytic metalloproteinase
LLYGAANQDLIWQAFARRGLGYSADQGSPTILEDFVEAFDLPPFLSGLNKASALNANLRLYPLPAGNALQVEAAKGTLPNTFVLYDAGGRQVRQWKNTEPWHAELDLSGLSDGFYLLDAGMAGRSRIIIRR